MPAAGCMKIPFYRTPPSNTTKDVIAIIWAGLRTLAAMGVLLGIAWGLRRYAPASWKRPLTPSARARRLETLPLGPKRQLVLVEIDHTIVGIGLHEHGMTVVYQGAAPPDAMSSETPRPNSDTIGAWLAERGDADAP